MRNFAVNFLFIAFFITAITGCGGTSIEPEKVFSVSVLVAEPLIISRTVMAPCRLEGSEEAVITIPVSGKIEEVFVSEGDTVTSGQLLISLSTDCSYSAETLTAAAGITAARANAEYADANFSRAGHLFQSGAISTQEYETAQSTAETANASLSQAVSGYQSARSRETSGVITAPFSGRIVRVWAKEGNMATGPLVSITGNGYLRSELLLAERHLPSLHDGLPAFFTSELYPGEIFKGILISHTQSVDPVSGLVPVVVQFSDSSNCLFSGMTGMVTITLETEENTLVLPERALRPVGNNIWEIALVEDGKAVIRAIETGIVNGNSFQIISGLNTGDSVIVLGNHLVSDNSSVEVVNR